MKAKLRASIIGMFFSSLVLGMFVFGGVQAARAETGLEQVPFNQWMYARYRKKRGARKAVRKSGKTAKKMYKARRSVRRARRS